MRITRWDKWEDPADHQNDDEGWNDNPKPNIIKVGITPMGPISIPEYLTPSKEFNFWTIHTNFRINQEIFEIMSMVDGVESLDIFSPYRARVGVGKLFTAKDVCSSIDDKLLIE